MKNNSCYRLRDKKGINSDIKSRISEIKRWKKYNIKV